jgi:hypothetical protein
VEHDNDDPVSDRRDRRTSDFTIVLVFLGGFGLLVALAVAGVLLGLLNWRTEPAPAQASADSMPVVTTGGGGAIEAALIEPVGGAKESWGHAELLAHLKAMGLRLEMRPTNRGEAPGEPGFYFFAPAQGKKQRADGPNLDEMFERGSGDVVFVQLKATPQKAKDDADPLGERGWHSGRFLFQVQDDGKPLLTKIKNALR